MSVANRHKKTKIGYDYVHTAIDDHTRLAGSETHDDEKDRRVRRSCTARWPGSPPTHRSAPRAHRQRQGLPRHRLGLGLHRVAAQTPLHQTRLSWTNGKAERFNRTLLQ